MYQHVRPVQKFVPARPPTGVFFQKKPTGSSHGLTCPNVSPKDSSLNSVKGHGQYEQGVLVCPRYRYQTKRGLLETAAIYQVPGIPGIPKIGRDTFGVHLGHIWPAAGSERARMGGSSSKDEQFTAEEITEAQGKAAQKGGSALTVGPRESRSPAL